MRAVLRTCAVCLIALVWTSAVPQSLVIHGQTVVNRDAAAIDDFQKRVAAYSALQRKLASTLPALPGKATPKQIDDFQRRLGQLVMDARKGAKTGDVFTPAMSQLVRRIFVPIFKGPEGASIRAAIIDEPHPVIPAVNTRYPDDVPLSTMPPDILKALPKLPDDGLEYRFIDRHLILLDVRAHLIVDVVSNAMPK